MNQPTQPGAEQPSPTASAIAELNVKVADLVRNLGPHEIVEVLSGRASTLLRADDNQNQNQNGSRAPRLPEA
jgi:hypothetical protein